MKYQGFMEGIMPLRLTRRPDQQIVITIKSTGARCVIGPPETLREINTSIGITADREQFVVTRDKVEPVVEVQP
jgi:hypothetical protein